MSKYAARVDQNQNTIEQALAQLGWGVKSMARVGQGFPDLLAVKAGRTVYIEVKNPKAYGKRKKPNPLQQELHDWFKRYGVEVLTVTTVEDLMILDREARSRYEGVPAREFYPE
jgi:hypothetical protein